MNRVIKFRVWDVKNKEFGSDILVSLVFDAYTALLGKSTFKDTFIKYDGQKYSLQQFTGLFDKNNKEIYEGDILEVAEQNYLIIFDKFGWRLSPGWYKSNHTIPLSHLTNIKGSKIKLTGNIYENPELLKK